MRRLASGAKLRSYAFRTIFPLQLAFCTHRSSNLWDSYRTIAGDEAARNKREAVHRAAFSRHVARRMRGAYGADPSGYDASPASAPVSSSHASQGGYGGGASAGVSNGGASQSAASAGGSCSCGVGAAGPPGVSLRSKTSKLQQLRFIAAWR